MAISERLYTVKEAAETYFQGKVSQRELYNLFDQGEVLGFRVGKKKILIYESSLDAYRLAHENKKAPVPSPEPEAPEFVPPVRRDGESAGAYQVRVSRATDRLRGR